jgi:DNA-binding transcriptional LysR family regulator
VGGIPPGMLREARFATHRLVIVPWVRDPWWLFAPGPVGHEGAGPVFDIERLGTPIRVFTYRSYTTWPAAATVDFLSAQFGRPVEVIVQDSLELVRGAVINGVGLGILPRSVMHVAAPQQLVPLFSLDALQHLTLRLLHRRARQLTPQVRTFLRYLIAHRQGRDLHIRGRYT